MIFSHIWSDFLRTKALSSPPLGGRYTLVLGERLNGIQEVSGSIPLISTMRHRKPGISGDSYESPDFLIPLDFLNFEESRGAFYGKNEDEARIADYRRKLQRLYQQQEGGGAG